MDQPQSAQASPSLDALPVSIGATILTTPRRAGSPALRRSGSTLALQWRDQMP
jgi:hypothetical protein